MLAHSGLVRRALLYARELLEPPDVLRVLVQLRAQLGGRPVKEGRRERRVGDEVVARCQDPQRAQRTYVLRACCSWHLRREGRCNRL